MPIWVLRMTDGVVSAFYVSLVALAFSIDAVKADAWDEFERRCLVTMENVQAPDLKGLAFVSPSSGVEILSGEDGLQMIVGHDASGHAICGFLNIEADEALWEKVRSWTLSAISDGRYVDATEKSSHALSAFRSTDWREPKMDVEIQSLADADGPSFIAVETDLES